MAAPIVSIFDPGEYERHVRTAAELLGGGGVVVLPTETVYGAAGVLSQPAALQRLKDLRGGTDHKPFTIHVAHRDQAQHYLGELNDFSRRLMKKLWPGPVALTFEVPEPRRRQVADELKVDPSDLYDESRITLRCPDHLVATDVIGLVAAPVVLTAGGTAGSHAADQLNPELGQRVDLILDAGPTRYSKPSTILRVRGESYEIVREGVYDQRIIEKMLHTTILFVCSGNTCRSPMAEAIARHMLTEKLKLSEEDLERKGISVMSAGTLALPGARATPQAVEAAAALGADLSHHRSRGLTVELIHQADVIFTMGRSHAAAVVAIVPSAADKVVTLNPEGDIEDPIGGDIALYQQLATRLRQLIEKRLEERAII